MTTTEKLIEAYNRADIGEAVRAKIASVLSPEALVIAIITLAGVFIASQFTPVGWAADLGLALTAVFVGTALFKAIQHLINFADARNATTPEQLDQAGAEFARAVAEVGVDAVILFVTHSVGGGAGETPPYEGPPPTGFVLATTRGGVLVRVAVNTISEETAAQLGVQASGLVLMSQGSGSGGSGSGSSGSGGSGSGSSGSGGSGNFSERLTQEVIDEMNLSRGGEYAETWELVNLEGPHAMATEDPALLNAPNAVRYQATFRDFTGKIEEISVNYDPATNRFGTIKRASGK
jgi:uncharacterized membrane protein YgcG